MKKIPLFCVGLLACFGMTTRLSAANTPFAIQPLAGTPLNYADKANWMVYTDQASAKHKVDLFYLYPTSVPGSCKTAIVEKIDAEMQHNARFSYANCGMCLADFANAYAPYYRQVSIVGIFQSPRADDLEKMCRESVVRTDVYAALDYFFEYLNHGRPFILAGHSQGSCNLKIVLAEYMRAHPEYLKRMVACYAIGYYFPDAWFKANPHVKKAQGETDTGILISWNSEGPNATMPNFCIGDGSFVINPLNWKTDETPAGIEKNLGSLSVDPKTLKRTEIPGKVGTRIDLKRGALICEDCTDYIPANPLFGDKSFHKNDWDFYYGNIRDNAKKRIQAYFSK